MYDMTRVNANGYFDFENSAEQRNAKRAAMATQRTEDYRNGPKGQPTRIARWEGPERIAPEWWLDRPGTRLRDYYKIEDANGQRLWLYREGLAGDGRGGAPRWFVQGVFA